MCFRAGLKERRAQPLPAAEEAGYPADLQQAYSELQARFQRTTNALGSAAHDLKTPLAILNGYVELLQSEKLGSLNARQREVLGDMQSSGKRLQQFIQDFLTYSALETGGLKMQFRAGQHQRVPVRRLPPVVNPLSGKRTSSLLPGE